MSDDRGDGPGKRRVRRPSARTGRRAGVKAPKGEAPGKPPAGDGPSAVVGIGTSAGGLDALKAFFKAMPADSGMALVVVQHLAPAHESQMADILSKYTAMPVAQAENGTPVRANCVYTIPASKYLAIRAGRLRLTEPVERHGMRMAIDFFFRSLAEDQQEKAVCVILSGSGSDGTHGLRSVRSAGGMCMAQDPKTAEFGIMPQSAIDTGLVDHVLPPDRMPAALVAYMHHFCGGVAGSLEPAYTGPSDELESILKLLRSRAKSDYHCYKKGTVVRRIERRMGLMQVAGMGDYLKLLRNSPEELAQLAKDMLIGVSSFFRDPEAFAELGKLAVTPLVAGKGADTSVRVWVAGCATGEEAYSVAILLLEALAAAGKANPIQVFASDVDEAALETARAGVYGDSITADVSPERLQRFFLRKDDHYQVCKQLRDTVVFARQNLIADPPFSKMDLITCRNVLIYLQPEAQSKVISRFSFALNGGGYLFLGKSESITNPRDLFETVSKPGRLYRLVRPNRHAADLPVFSGVGRAVGMAADRAHAAPSAAGLALLNQQILLEHFGAAIVLVEPKGRVLHFHGPTEKYLGHPKGQASLKVFDMAAAGLAAKLRRAMGQAVQAGALVALQHAPGGRQGPPPVNVTVVPVPGRAGEESTLAIILEDALPTATPRHAARKVVEDESAVAQLEAEIRALRTELDRTSQEHESVSEELKAANEEVMSMNEELQSTNEEMETSKEELQSINEELSTVNSQLSEKVGELTDANNDLANLAGATEIATVFLDAELRVKQFTPQATELLNLISSDIGRPLSHIAQNFDGKSLAADAAAVMKDLSPVEREVQISGGRWYTMRILPYRTLDNRIDGAVVTFVDVSRLKRLEVSLERAKAYAESIVGTVREPLLVLDSSLRVVSANASFYQTFQAVPKTTVGQFVYDLGEGQWNTPELRRLMEEVVLAQSEFQDFHVERDFPGLGPRIIRLNARRMEPAEDQPALILLAIEDVTDREQTRFEVLLAELSSEFINLPADQVDRQIEDAQRRICECLGLDLSSLWQRSAESPGDLILTHVYCLPDFPRPSVLMKASEAFPWCRQQVLAGRVVAVSSVEETPAEAARDKEVWRQLGIKTTLTVPLSTGEGPTIGALSFNTMRSERTWPEAIIKRLHLVAQVFANALARKRADEALRESEQRFLQVSDAAGRFIWEVDAEGLYTYASPSAEKILGYTPAELVGKKHFYDLFVPSDREELKAAAFQAFADRRAFRDSAYPNVDKSGTVVHLETSGLPVLDGAGTLVGYRGVATNVTERKQAETEVQRQRAELSRIARVSTMGQLASSLAHELSQPLGAILRNAEAAELFLRDPSPDLDELRAILADIRKDDQRAGEVIDRMRAMMKRREFDRRRLDVGVLVDEVGALARPDAERRRVRLVLETDAALPPVQGDLVQLQQVLLNLVLNAMDALDDNPPVASVVTVRARPAGTMVEVAVSDNGHGIPADSLPRVFEPFFTTKPNGLGMGLAISRSIIEAHDGRLWAENNAAGGATFTFALPVAEGGHAK